MKFGIFDSLDLGIGTPEDVLRDRLRLAELADQWGVDHYHVTEHHGTPLSVCPSPNLFLAALAQRTTRIRMGALVLVLPAYEPVRLAEEIAVLDQMSNGRLDIGVGRGVSPYELEYVGADPGASLNTYSEMLGALTQALETGRFAHRGTLLRDIDVELSIGPAQSPYPPIWYASSNVATAEWAGQNGVHFVGRWNDGQFLQGAEAYWNAWDDRDPRAAMNRQDQDRPRVGFNSTLVIGDTDEQALAMYREHQARFKENTVLRWHEHGNHRVDGFADPDTGLAVRNAVVGTVDSVVGQFREMLSSGLVNYLEVNVYFGNMSFEESRRNLERYARQVIPALRSVHPHSVAAGVPTHRTIAAAEDPR